jgi:hypothetical protein
MGVVRRFLGAAAALAGPSGPIPAASGSAMNGRER